MKVLKSLKSCDFKAADIYNMMTDLLAWLWSPGFPYTTGGCKEAMVSAAAKLSKYLEETKQLATQLVKAVHVLKPSQLPVLPHTFDDYLMITPALAAAADEWPIYTDLAKEAMPDNVSSFWQSLMQQNQLTKLAELAKVYLALPVASVNVEHSFLPTALAWEVMQSPPSACLSICPSVRLFPLYLRNQLTTDLELL